MKKNNFLLSVLSLGRRVLTVSNATAHRKRLKLLFTVALLLCSWVANAAGTVHIVTNTNDDGDGSLRAIINALPNNGGTETSPVDTIVFDSELNGDTITLLTTITVSNKDVVINGGDNNIVISGGGAIRLFTFNGTNWKVEFSNLTLTGGFVSTGVGSAISYSSSKAATYKLNNVRFINNTAYSSGGAIHVATGSSHVNHCTFIGNKTTQVSTAGYGGGAIYSTVPLNISNSIFEDNSSNARGGAILANNFTVIGSVFKNNSAVNYGGAIAIRPSGTPEAKLLGNTFIGNHTNGGTAEAVTGGGVLGFPASTTVHGSVFLAANIFQDNTSGTDATYNEFHNLNVGSTITSNGYNVFKGEAVPATNDNIWTNAATDIASAGGIVDENGRIAGSSAAYQIVNTATALIADLTFPEKDIFGNTSSVPYNAGADQGTACFFALIVQSADEAMGGVAVTQANTCENDNMAIIEATALGGYQFTQWSDGNTDNPRTLSVTKDTVLTAFFAASAQAYSFSAENEGKTIYYNITSTAPLTVAVACESTSYNSYSGAIIIPATVTNEGNTYAVTSIGNNAFRASTGLTSVTLPASITAIGEQAFQGCTGLQSISVYLATPPAVGTDAFTGVPTGIPVHIPCGTLAAYQNATGWSSSFTNFIDPFPALFVQSADNAMGSVAVTQVNTCADNTAIIAATALDGYKFTQWSDGSIENPHTVTVTKDTVLTAQFAALTYDFSAVNNGQTIYYNITSAVEPLTVAVACESTAYNSYSGAIVIPATVTNEGNTYAVTSIGNNAFRASTGLTSVTLPAGIASVGEQAFQGCTGLASIYENAEIPPAVGTDAFTGVQTGIPVHLPCGALAAYQNATGWTGFTNFIAAPPPVLNVNANPAWGSVAVIQANTCENGDTAIIEAIPAFKFRFTQWSDGNTDNPRSLSVTQNTTLTAQFVAVRYDFAAVNDGQKIYYIITSTDPLTVEITYATDSYNSYSGAVSIPDTVTHLEVTYTVKTVGNSAFQASTGLTEVTIPNSVLTIGERAFYGCTGLTEVTVPNSVTTIGESIFIGCTNLKTVTMSSSIATLSSYVFQGCTSLSSIVIPESVITIGRNVFLACSSLETIAIPNSVMTTGIGVFYGCTKLKTVTMSNAVAILNDYVFQNCTSLSSIVIPESVTTIGISAFHGCTGLTSIYVNAETPPVAGTDAFTGVSASIPVHIPCGTLAAYQSAARWSSFTNFINPLPVLTVQSANDAQGSVAITQANTCADNTAIIAATPLSGYQFVQWSDDNTDNPRTVTVTQDTTLTAQFAVQVRYDFSAVNDGNEIYYNVIPASSPQAVEVTYATDWYNNYSGAVVIPATVTNEGNTYAVTSVGNNAFRASTGLTSVTLPASIASVGEQAFANCTGLAEIYVNAETPPAVGTDAFSGVSASIPVHIPCGTLAAYQNATGWSSSFTNFIDPLPSLTVQSANDAQGSVAVTQVNTCADNTAIIAATALDGYLFTQWNDGNTDNPRTLAVTQDTTFTATFDIITGIEGTQATALALYPNPVRDELFISGISGDANVEITDLSGRTVVKNISPLQTGEISINVSHLAKGVYLVKIGNVIGKFVKE